MTERICRFCLQTINDGFQAITEALKDILHKLFLYLNLDISTETVICNECAENLQASYNFMSTCVQRDRTNDVSLELKNIGNSNNQTADHVRCCFCTKTEGEDFMSLNESKGNMFSLDLLEEYIPDLDLNTEELLTCASCLYSLQEFLNFVRNRLKVEDKIKKYVEIEGTNDEGQVDLKDVQKFTFKPTLGYEMETEMLERREQIQEQHCMKVEVEIEDKNDTGGQDLLLKTEEIFIKSEENDNDSFQETQIIATDSGKIDTHQRAILFSTDNEMDEKNDSLTEVTMYKCVTCTYETKEKSDLNRHVLSHLNRPSKKYKCENCTYEAAFKHALIRHISLAHKTASKPTTYKCEMCTYETMQKHHLARHVLIHKTPSEVTMNKCKICTYETREKSNLNRHMLTHESPSETTVYTCELCTYCSIHESYFVRHMASHDGSVYSCEICSYETKCKSNFKRHNLTHKSSSEVTMYKCEMCTYETKQKHHLARHILIHKSPSEVAANKCKMCTFDANGKADLHEHMLTHKDPSDVTFKCELCTYEAKQARYLKMHMYSHKTPAVVHKCDMCTYQTKYKSSLNQHVVIHKSPSEITMYKCEKCKYQAKHKSGLNRHKLTHKNKCDISQNDK